jgi:peptidoglycan/xylan/chitin deacetylase (PgdA/CDA1 family)
MYHRISAPVGGRGHQHPYFQTETDPVVFEEQMKTLHAAGYEAVDLQTAVARLSSLSEVKHKSVAITFDDGFRDFYTHAFPILNKYGLTATMFLPTGYIRAERHSRDSKQYLTWAEVRELRKAGIAFGSHTVSHPELSLLPWNRVEYELKASRAAIEDNIGDRVTTFAYPFAFPEHLQAFKERLKALLLESGYREGVNTVIGTASDRSEVLFLERLPVNSFDDATLLGAKLEGAYDWLRLPQLLYKHVKALRS